MPLLCLCTYAGGQASCADRRENVIDSIVRRECSGPAGCRLADGRLANGKRRQRLLRGDSRLFRGPKLLQAVRIVRYRVRYASCLLWLAAVALQRGSYFRSR